MQELDKYKNILLLVCVAFVTFLVCRSIYDKQSLLLKSFVEKKSEITELVKLIETWEVLDEETRRLRSSLVFQDVSEMKQLVEYSAQKSKVNIVSIRPLSEDKGLYDSIKISISITNTAFSSFLNFIAELEDRNVSVLTMSIAESTVPGEQRLFDLSLGGYVIKKP